MRILALAGAAAAIKGLAAQNAFAIEVILQKLRETPPPPLVPPPFTVK